VFLTDRAERYDFGSRFLLFILLFFFPLFLGGKSKGEENNQSRGQMVKSHAFLLDLLNHPINLYLFYDIQYFIFKPRMVKRELSSLEKIPDARGNRFWINIPIHLHFNPVLLRNIFYII
jgi:hypothetical protein